MTNTKLAEALRLARDWFRYEEAGEGPQAEDVIKAADEALAAHDAEQAALRDLECPPDPEMVDRALADTADLLDAVAQHYHCSPEDVAEAVECERHALREVA